MTQIFVAVGNAKAGFDSGLGSAIHLQGQLTFRKLILLARELRRETRTGAPISVVHALSPRLWASAIAIGAALNAPTLCDTDNSAPSVLALGTWNVRLLLRAFKPVMVTPTEAGRAPVPSSVPSVVVPEIAHDSPCARYVPLHALYARRRLERASSPHFLAINARYESRPTTGVERFAQETTTRMSRPIARFAPSRLYSRGPVGHLWEQIVLPLRLAPYRCHLWSPCNFGPIARRDQTVTIHDIAPVDHPEWFGPRYGPWFAFVTWALYHRARCITTVSQFTKNRLHDHWGPKDNVVIVPPGVSDSFSDVTATPARRAPTATRRYVCFVGSLEPRENLSHPPRCDGSGPPDDT